MECVIRRWSSAKDGEQMIRGFQKTDIDEIAAVWLSSNLEAHDFIDSQYWTGNLEAVKKLLPQAELYVYEEKGKILGFAGLRGDYVEGIFVRSEARSCGIGKQLLDYVKDIRTRLSLHVYAKNQRALQFYLRENFHIRCEYADESTGEKEYEMVWER